jgi:hypothetical protein
MVPLSAALAAERDLIDGVKLLSKCASHLISFDSELILRHTERAKCHSLNRARLQARAALAACADTTAPRRCGSTGGSAPRDQSRVRPIA